MPPRRTAFIALVIVALAPVSGRADADCDWPMYGYDPGRSFAQEAACSAITPLTVGGLAPAWLVQTSSPVTASPSVVDGTVYVGSNSGTFYAIDAATGAVRWTFEVSDDNSVGFGVIVSSAAVTTVAGTTLVLFGGGATLYALDAADGSELASVCVDPRDPDDPSISRCGGSPGDIEIESSPAVVDVDGETWVLVGMDVHNRPNVGRTGVIAFRLAPPATPADRWLETLWKFDPENRSTYTPSNSPDPLTEGHGTGDGCGGVWSSPAVDVAGDMVFLGTASCSEGDLATGPLSGESMFGIHLRSGGFAWHANPRVEHSESTRLDDDFGASPNLLPNGLVGFAGKDGRYYARRRSDGAPAWEQKHGQAGHLTVDFAIGGTIGTPAVGEVFDEPTIFATTAISTPVGTPLDEFDENTIDQTLAEDPGRLFSIHAISALDGRIVWRSPLSRQSYAAPTYARGLVFVPSTVDFAVNVFHADTGVLLRRLPLNGAPSSAPAIVGDSIFVGSGTSVDPFPFNDLSGIWGFRLVA